MTDSDAHLVQRIRDRLNLAPHDADVSEQPTFMVAIHSEDGSIVQLPYQSLHFIELKPEDRMAERASPARATLEFSNAAVHFEGEHLEIVMRLLQEHRLRRLRVTIGGLTAHGFSVRNLHCGPPKPSKGTE